jgi:Ca2+/Na+ antiporter
MLSLAFDFVQFNVMTNFLLFTAGLAALVFGANLLVRGAGKLGAVLRHFRRWWWG